MGKSASPDPDQVHADVRAPARQACYKARDAFYACLEMDLRKEIGSVGLMYPVDYNIARAQYEVSCPDFWVKHFDAQYCKDKRRQRPLDDKTTRKDPLLLPQPYTFKNTTTSS